MHKSYKLKVKVSDLVAEGPPRDLKVVGSITQRFPGVAPLLSTARSGDGGSNLKAGQISHHSGCDNQWQF